MISVFRFKLLFVIAGLIGFIIACNSPSNQEDSKKSKPKPTFNKEEITEPTLDLNSIDYEYLQSKVFEVGSVYDFTDSCVFYFECDCCSGELIFNADSSFYYSDYCMSDQTILFGKYFLEKQILHLNFSGIQVAQIYNYENEIDTSAIDYFMEDTVIQANQTQYKLELCNNKLKLKRVDKNFLAVETDEDPSLTIKYLNKEGFIKRYQKIKDSLANQVDFNYARSYVLIVDTNTNYYSLRDKMIQIGEQLSIEVDTMERTYYPEKNLIALPEDHEDELFAGDYYPRRYSKEYLSLEYLDLYQRPAGDKTIALVAGIYSNQESADSTLQRILEVDSSAFILQTDIYVGCIH